MPPSGKKLTRILHPPKSLVPYYGRPAKFRLTNRGSWPPARDSHSILCQERLAPKTFGDGRWIGYFFTPIYAVFDNEVGGVGSNLCEHRQLIPIGGSE